METIIHHEGNGRVGSRDLSACPGDSYPFRIYRIRHRSSFDLVFSDTSAERMVASLCLFGAAGRGVMDDSAGLDDRRGRHRVAQAVCIRERISWEEFASLHYNFSSKYFTVRDSDGRKIVDTAFHAEGPMFMNKVRERTRLPMKITRPGALKRKAIELPPYVGRK